jgi:hypothetical protein
LHALSHCVSGAGQCGRTSNKNGALVLEDSLYIALAVVIPDDLVVVGILAFPLEHRLFAVRVVITVLRLNEYAVTRLVEVLIDATDAGQFVIVRRCARRKQRLLPDGRWP